MDLMQHLSELRKRIFYSLIAITICAIFSYFFSSEVFNILSEPYFKSFTNESLIGTGPAEAFLLKIKTACFVGALIASPVLFLQFWLFIAPGLYSNEKKMLVPFVFSATLLFIGGVSFCYYNVLPIAFEFFYNQYSSIGVTPTIRITEHLSLIIKILLGFGLVFEIPVISFFLARVGVLSSSLMINSWKYVLVSSFIIGALLTPPDVISQFLMAIPLMILYSLSILIVKAVEKKESED